MIRATRPFQTPFGPISFTTKIHWLCCAFDNFILTISSSSARVLVDDGNDWISWMRDDSTEDTSNVTSGESDHQLFTLNYNKYPLNRTKKKLPLSIDLLVLVQHIHKERQQSFRNKRISSLCMESVSSRVVSNLWRKFHFLLQPSFVGNNLSRLKSSQKSGFGPKHSGWL